MTRPDSRHPAFLGAFGRLLALAVAVLLLGGATAPRIAAAATDDADADAAFRSALDELGVTERLATAPLDTLPPQPGVQDYVGYALAHNPRLHAAVAEWRALSRRSDRVSSLPDPRFVWSEYLVPVETRVGPQRRAFALSQTIPWFGTLSSKGRVEEERAAAAAARVNAVAVDVATAVERAYHELAYLASAVEFNAEHLRLLTSWEEVARSRYATGGGTYADVIKAQVEIGKLADRVAELRDRRRPLAADLNAELNRPRLAPVDWPEPVAAAVTELPEDELVARMAADNPELSGLRHEAVSFRQAEELAGKQGMPGLTLGLSYIQTDAAEMPGVTDSGKDPIIASLGVSIPLWRGQYDAAAEEAESRYLAVHATRHDRENELTAALERAFFDHRDAVRKLDLYDATLVPKAKQALQATLASYETGKSDFLDLVDAERVLLEFQLAGARAATNLNISLAEIEGLVGGPVHPPGDTPRREGRGDEER